jgi:hypothetical protein
MINLTKEECKAVYELIGHLSGGNPEYAFANDGSDDMADPMVSACVKIYRAAGGAVPKTLR